MSLIDVTYSMYNDSMGRDPDSYSKTLNKYHSILWSKKLPSNYDFELKLVGKTKFILKHKSSIGDFEFSSDLITHTFREWNLMKNIIEEMNKFINLSSTIGGFIIFPSKRVNNKPTINACRGMNHKIKDRFDLTLECIRLWYLGEPSPLYECLNRYRDFFDLFINFKGYVDHFLLNDLTDNNNNIKFWLQFKDFNDYKILPSTSSEYKLYMTNVMEFINKRNLRIKTC